MNRIFIIGILTLLVSCGTQKQVAVEGEQPITKKDYPYIEAFHQGVRFKAQGRVDDAIRKFELCLTMRQDDDAVYYALSQLYLIKNELNKSAESIEKAAELDPDNTWYIQELAYMYFEMANYPKAVENFKKLTEIEPGNIDWLYGYAEALVRNGEELKAIEALQKTEDQVGSHPEFTIQKYKLYMAINDEESALKELEEGKKQFPKSAQIIATMVDHYFKKGEYAKAIEMLEELVIADPSNGRAHLALADVYRQQGKKDKAYQELREAFPSDDVDLDTKMQVLISIHESSSTVDKEAMELVDILVMKYPNEAKVYSIKADFLLKQEKDDEALKSYRKALEYDKSLYPIWNQVLIMEYQASLFEDLYNDSKECLELFPTISTAYLLNGVSANQLKKYDQALDVLSAGIELVINDPAMKAEFYGQLGEAQFGLKNVEEGKKNYKKAIELDSRSNLLKNNFAFRLASAKEDLQLATSLIKQAIENSPGQGQYMDTYGWILFQQGKMSEAKEKFEKAYELNSGDKLIIEHLGDVNFKLGKTNDALEWWKEAQKIAPDDELLQKKITNKKYYEPDL